MTFKECIIIIIIIIISNNTYTLHLVSYLIVRKFLHYHLITAQSYIKSTLYELHFCSEKKLAMESQDNQSLSIVFTNHNVVLIYIKRNHKDISS